MKKIAIIGASYLQLPLVLKAKAMQLEVHCFAWEDGAVCKDYCDFFYPVSVLDKEAILAICEEKKIDGITTIATDIAIPTISYVAQKLGLIANSVDSAAMSTNKVLMRESFSQGNVCIPKFVEVEAYNPELFRDFTFPIIVKPVDRSGSRGVSKAENTSELQDAIPTAVEDSIAKKAIAEEFIEGDEVSVESISWQGKHYILTITDKVTTGSPHFVELEHHQPSKLSLEIQQKIKSETIKVLDAVGVKYGAGHAEFKITTSDEVYAIEVGARMGGDFIGSHL
ncbi:MAG TPA: ATP-grasp domain-containing protein, partial [Flavobacterium sp.]|nr:ATP-grasp domain-containing protein [Flavobacterium sp.]